MGPHHFTHYSRPSRLPDYWYGTHGRHCHTIRNWLPSQLYQPLLAPGLYLADMIQFKKVFCGTEFQYIFEYRRHSLFNNSRLAYYCWKFSFSTILFSRLLIVEKRMSTILKAIKVQFVLYATHWRLKKQAIEWLSHEFAISINFNFYITDT